MAVSNPNRIRETVCGNEGRTDRRTDGPARDYYLFGVGINYIRIKWSGLGLYYQWSGVGLFYFQGLSNGDNMVFLHDRSWISPWIKSISSELDITCHVFASQLSGHCDVIANRLWRHQQNVKLASKTLEWCVKILVLSVIYGFVMSCEK